MIAVAAALVLAGLGLFVAGVVTGETGLYWACVAVCGLAAVPIVLARRSLDGAAPAAAEPPDGRGPAAPDGAPGGATEGGLGPDGEPPLEETEVTDLLLLVDSTDEVLVVDEHPRYHLAGCRHLAGRTTFALPLDEARTDGFTPCGSCCPDRNLAARARGD